MSSLDPPSSPNNLHTALQPLHPSQSSNDNDNDSIPPSSSPLGSPRRRKQAGLFFGGLAFVFFSSLVTRRSLARRYRPAIPIASQLQSTSASARHIVGSRNAPHTPAIAAEEVAAASAEEAEAAAAAAAQNAGPIVALEALGLATVNVLSWAIAAAGGALWYFDISSVDDLRRRVRGGLGVDGSGRTEREVEEEMEEWLAGVLVRKEEKERIRAEVGALKGEAVNERGKPR